MAIKVDAEKCIGCGACVSTAAEVFEMSNGKAVPKGDEFSPDQVEQAKTAAGVCPVDAISVE